ncbi:MAG TPA: thioredoxin-disulfide reductase [Candidatus Limnocylindrales bacterium]|nr:thioredoxin-disulfide reductase [Candidatus Limnocylindrales bacterium]
MNLYDVIIIGGGPAGLTAGIYASRSKLKTLLIEKSLAGGQIAITDHIENYPGFSVGSGQELTAVMEEQARKFGTEVMTAAVTTVEQSGSEILVSTSQGDLRASAVIVATGCAPRKLNAPGEDEFIGRGVSFCATCDGPFYEELPIMVVGGGDAAVEEALYLTRYAEKVYLVHRRDALRATKVVQERAFANDKIEFVWDSVVETIYGNETLERVVVKNLKNGQVKAIPVNGIFIYVGSTPNTGFVAGKVRLSEKGYIITNDRMETSAPGIFAAGDCRQKLLRQVVTATGDGATAAFAVEKYLEENQKNS